jgi:hypothetical protein
VKTASGNAEKLAPFGRLSVDHFERSTVARCQIAIRVSKTTKALKAKNNEFGAGASLEISMVGLSDRSCATYNLDPPALFFHGCLVESERVSD